MYTSSESLRSCSFEELSHFASSREPSLRQLHAVEEMARRAVTNTELLSTVTDTLTRYLGHGARVSGLPVGYPAAAVLYRAGGDAQRVLLNALAVLSPEQRDDLLRWLTSERREKAVREPVVIERDLLLEVCVGADDLAAALSELTGEPVKVDLIPLKGIPCMLVMVGLTLAGWDQLDHRAADLARRLNTTVYLWPPEALGGLHPDLRLAIRPDGTRALVVSKDIGEGYEIRPFVR